MKSSSEGSLGSIEQYKTLTKCCNDLSKNMSCPEIYDLHDHVFHEPIDMHYRKCFHRTVDSKKVEQNMPETSIAINITTGNCPDNVVKKLDKVLVETPRVLNNEQKSPESALKSQKKLEWDSLGDIGYRSNSNSDSISTLERSVLKDFFAKRGMQVNFSSKKKNLDKLFARLKNAKNDKSEESEEKSEDLTAKFLDLPHSTPKTPMVDIQEEQESSEGKKL